MAQGQIDQSEFFNNGNASITVIEAESYAKVSNCKIHNDASTGIFISYGRAALSNSEIYQCKKQGIELRGKSANLEIDSCQIHNNTLGIYVHDKGSGTAKNCTMKNNRKNIEEEISGFFSSGEKKFIVLK